MWLFEEDDLKKIADVYHTWQNCQTEPAEVDVAGFSKTASLEVVKANSYMLSPGRSVGTEAEEDDGISFEEKMRKLSIELMNQFEEGERLGKEIRENLKSIQFE